MKLIDKEIAQIIENNLFSDSKQKFINFFGPEQYQFLLHEIYLYSVLKNDENVLRSLLGKANYIIEDFDTKNAINRILKDLAKLYLSGFSSSHLMQLVKAGNKPFDLELRALRELDFQGNILESEPEEKAFKSDLVIEDHEIERALILFERQYWKNRFKKIDKEFGDESTETARYKGMQASYEREPMMMMEESMHSKSQIINEKSYTASEFNDENMPPKSNKIKIIFIAAVLVLIAFLLWYFLSN
jgi:hypothetical protein